MYINPSCISSCLDLPSDIHIPDWTRSKINDRSQAFCDICQLLSIDHHTFPGNVILISICPWLIRNI